jgi:hypothetical protein
VPNSPAQAVAIARTYSTYAPGLCLQWVRTCLGVPPKYDDAETAWQNALHKHPGAFVPPLGVPVWWENNSIRGHVALSDGYGGCYSTDYPSRGRVGRVGIAKLTTEWNMHYRGWTEDINGVVILSGGSASLWEGVKRALSNLTPTSVAGGEGAGTPTGLVASLSTIGNAIGFVADPHNWARAGMFTLGGALLVVILLLLVTRTGAGKALPPTARKVAGVLK